MSAETVWKDRRARTLAGTTLRHNPCGTTAPDGDRLEDRGAQTLRHNRSAQPPGGDRSGRLLGTNPYRNAPIGATIQHNRNISIKIYPRVNYNSLDPTPNIPNPPLCLVLI